MYIYSNQSLIVCYNPPSELTLEFLQLQNYTIFVGVGIITLLFLLLATIKNMLSFNVKQEIFKYFYYIVSLNLQ